MGCLTSFSRSRSGSQVMPLGGIPEGDICGSRFGSQVDICGGRFGSQVDIHGVGAGGKALRASVGVAVEVSGPDVHYSGEKLLTQLFSIENNLSIYAL